MGERANHRLTLDERNQHARLKPYPAGTSFGDYLPDRVVRGIVLARLTNFVEGHAATTPRIAQAVAEMLDGDPMPPVAAAGRTAVRAKYWRSIPCSPTYRLASCSR